MKHIQTKKLFESSEAADTQLATIKDICLDLEDKKYKVIIDKEPFSGLYYVMISPALVDTRQPLNYLDVKEEVDRIRRYLTMLRQDGYGVRVVNVKLCNMGLRWSVYNSTNDLLPLRAVRISIDLH